MTAHTVDSHNRLCVVGNVAQATEMSIVVLGRQKLKKEIGQRAPIMWESFLDAKRTCKS